MASLSSGFSYGLVVSGDLSQSVGAAVQRVQLLFEIAPLNAYRVMLNVDESQIGEIAGEIRRSAWRSFLGLPKPPTEIKNPTIWDYMAFVAPFVGVLAIVLSVISRVLRENWRFAAYGTALGASAIVFHYFWWVAMLFAGVILLVAIIENIGDIFSFD